MYLVINKCVTAVILSNFSRHYLRNRSTSDRGVLGYIGLLQLKEHSPEVWHIPPWNTCIYIYIYIYIIICVCMFMFIQLKLNECVLAGTQNNNKMLTCVQFRAATQHVTRN